MTVSVRQAFKGEQTFLSARDLSAHEHQTETSALSSSSTALTKTRRRLPHWKKDGFIYWITFRLADAIPQDKRRAWKQERDIWFRLHPELWSEADWKEHDQRFGEKIEAWLDAGMGSRALARPDIREAVRICLLRFNGERLLLHAAIIMPTHVHLLLEPLKGHDLSRLLQGIKGASAREANKRLGTAGTFWLDESFDHVVRSEKQYQRFVRYIADNPVKAGLKKHEYWLYLGDSDIPVCAVGERQTGMSASPSISQRLDRLTNS